MFGTLLGALAGGGKGAAIGAVAGGAAGAGAQTVTRGQAVRVPAETVLTFRLDEPLRIAVDPYTQDRGYDENVYHYHNNYYFNLILETQLSAQERQTSSHSSGRSNGSGCKILKAPPVPDHNADTSIRRVRTLVPTGISDELSEDRTVSRTYTLRAGRGRIFAPRCRVPISRLLLCIRSDRDHGCPSVTRI